MKSDKIIEKIIRTTWNGYVASSMRKALNKLKKEYKKEIKELEKRIGDSLEITNSLIEVREKLKQQLNRKDKEIEELKQQKKEPYTDDWDCGLTGKPF